MKYKIHLTDKLWFCFSGVLILCAFAMCLNRFFFIHYKERETIQSYLKHSLKDLLCVLVQALLQLVGVGPDAAAEIVGVLFDHGCELCQVLGAALLGVHHVLLKPVGQELHVLGHLTGRDVGVWGQFGLDVISVCVQLGHGVSDQGTGNERAVII